MKNQPSGVNNRPASQLGTKGSSDFGGPIGGNQHNVYMKEKPHGKRGVIEELMTLQKKE